MVLLLAAAFDLSIAIQREDNKEKEEEGNQTKHHGTFCLVGSVI